MNFLEYKIKKTKQIFHICVEILILFQVQLQSKQHAIFSAHN